MNIRKEQLDAISRAVDELFYSTKAKLLGNYFQGPKIFFEVAYTADPLETIEGLFRYTLQLMFPGAQPDQKIIETLANITGDYVDAKRLQTKNKIVMDLIGAKTTKEANRLVQEHMQEATRYIDMLVNNESKIAQAYAEREGIHRVAASVGVDDPVVCKLGIIDDRMCANCRKLWHTPENIWVPKVYRMSELAEGYNKDNKNPIPTVGSTHPRCRHSMSFVPPNYGFDLHGTITFKGLGWDEWEFQRNGIVEKSESKLVQQDNFFELCDECAHELQ